MFYFCAKLHALETSYEAHCALSAKRSEASGTSISSRVCACCLQSFSMIKVRTDQLIQQLLIDSFLVSQASWHVWSVCASFCTKIKGTAPVLPSLIAYRIQSRKQRDRPGSPQKDQDRHKARKSLLRTMAAAMASTSTTPPDSNMTSSSSSPSSNNTDITARIIAVMRDDSLSREQKHCLAQVPNARLCTGLHEN